MLPWGSSSPTRSACLQEAVLTLTLSTTAASVVASFVAQTTVRSSRSLTPSRASRAASVRTPSASASTTPAVQVIIVGPELKSSTSAGYSQEDGARALLKPFIYHRLEQNRPLRDDQAGQRDGGQGAEEPIVWDILEEGHQGSPRPAQPRSDASPSQHPGL